MVSTKPASFVTFGMFIVDEIEWQSTKNIPSKHDLIGGAGTYAVLGARLASSPCQLRAKDISWIVDVGSDFPSGIKATIDSWKTDCVYRNDPSRLTTRAINRYGDDDYRSFEYLTPKIRLEVGSLNHRQLRGNAFHMVCSPQRCSSLMADLTASRMNVAHFQPPMIVWEPIPDMCRPNHLALAREVAKQVAIISTNHNELRTFFPPEAIENCTQHDLANLFMAPSTGHPESKHGSGILIVREGAKGSTAYWTARNQVFHLPAYHNKDMQSLVIDPTGAGNTYLGALAMMISGDLEGQPTHDLIIHRFRSIIPGFLGRPDNKLPEHENDIHYDPIIIAMVYATIAASFVVEQHGVPLLEQTKNFTEIVEKWNGQTFIERVTKYLDREEPTFRARLSRVKEPSV